MCLRRREVSLPAATGGGGISIAARWDGSFSITRTEREVERAHPRISSVSPRKNPQSPLTLQSMSAIIHAGCTTGQEPGASKGAKRQRERNTEAEGKKKQKREGRNESRRMMLEFENRTGRNGAGKVHRKPSGPHRRSPLTSRARGGCPLLARRDRLGSSRGAPARGPSPVAAGRPKYRPRYASSHGVSRTGTGEGETGGRELTSMGRSKGRTAVATRL